MKVCGKGLQHSRLIKARNGSSSGHVLTQKKTLLGRGFHDGPFFDVFFTFFSFKKLSKKTSKKLQKKLKKGVVKRPNILRVILHLSCLTRGPGCSTTASIFPRETSFLSRGRANRFDQDCFAFPCGWAGIQLECDAVL